LYALWWADAIHYLHKGDAAPDNTQKRRRHFYASKAPQNPWVVASKVPPTKFFSSRHNVDQEVFPLRTSAALALRNAFCGRFVFNDGDDVLGAAEPSPRKFLQNVLYILDDIVQISHTERLHPIPNRFQRSLKSNFEDQALEFRTVI
jgi:hypothetical protein